jgi:hypothetical protein
MIRSRWAWPPLALLTLVSCQSGPDPSRSAGTYLATELAVDVGVGPGLCIAVDLGDPNGVWWWEPGNSGCGSRSTGPGLFHPADATVTRSTEGGGHLIGFRLGTHSTTRPFVDVRLVVDRGTMRVAGSAAAVPLVRRSDLEIPEMPGRGSAG